MSLLMIIFLISSTGIPEAKSPDGTRIPEVKAPDDFDSLKVNPIVVTTSEEEVDPVFQYTFGMDTYRAGFNKGSISTNTLEESINTSNGNLEFKIKLLSLPMRGNKDYDLYLTYKGSPISIPGMQLREPYPYKRYGFDRYPTDVEDSLFKGQNDNQYIVTSDMGNCGLGWNVMPGELSLNPLWQMHYISGEENWSKRRDGFLHLNGGKKYNIYNLFYAWTDKWFISGERNWDLNYDTYMPILSTPEYVYEFDVYPIEYENPRDVELNSKREIHTLNKMTDRNGNYIDIDWYFDYSDIAPKARIPRRICTPTDTVYIYCDSIPVDTNVNSPPNDRYCLWDFHVIDSIVRNVNGEKYKVNFYYHQEWFPLILEYWYGHAFVLLDSVEFLKDGDRIKPAYRFEYEDTLDAISYPYSKQGELIGLMTPDGAKYEYSYNEKAYTCYEMGNIWPNTVEPYISKYRVVKDKIVTLPDTTHIESGDAYTPDGVCKYEYCFGGAVDASSGQYWYDPMHPEEYYPHLIPLTYYPIYEYCEINMPDTGRITYLNVDSTYVNNLLTIIARHVRELYVKLPFRMLPFDREEFYGKPHMIITSNDHLLGPDDHKLKLEQFYWTISEEVPPSWGQYLEYPVHPFLRYKAVQMDPDDDTIQIGEKANVYHYEEYDQYDNEKVVSFLGEATLIDTSSYTIVYVPGIDEWRVNGMPVWEDSDPSDNWAVMNSYLYEQDSEYADSFLYNLVDSTIKYDHDGDTVQKVTFEYDGKSLSGVTNPPMHGDAPYGGKRGNLTKKTEWMNEEEPRSQEYEYDECGNLVEMKDYMGYDYELYYCPSYVFPDSVISPDGLTTDFNFDRKGRLTSVKDKSGIIDSFEYDINGRITIYRKGIPGNMELLGKYKYDDFLKKAKEITYKSAGFSDTTIYSYDGLGRLINFEKCAPDTVVVDYIYNGNGQVSRETQPRFSDVSLYDADFTIKTFDGLGRVTEIEYPKSSSESGAEFITYEYNGDITDIFDELGEQTTLIKDASGNLDTVIDALGNYTYYYYNVNGNLTEIEDAEGKYTYFEYDWLGNLVKREGPDRGIDTFAYDSNGNTIYHKNNSGDEIEFEYDVLGRIKKKFVNDVESEVYSYDSYSAYGGVITPPSGLNYPEGRLTGFKNTDIAEVYFYDKLGKLGEKWVILDPLNLPPEDIDTFKYSYDLQGELTELEYPGDYKVNYEYDKLGNISSIEINNEITVTFSSTAAGLVSGIHFPGAVTDTFTYLPRRWMDSMAIKGIPNPYNHQKEFQYNKRGELMRIWKDRDGDDWTELYEYDELGRLTREVSAHDYTYSYDAVGNRIVLNYGTVEYEYEEGTNRLIDDGENTYSYDANGRPSVMNASTPDEVNFTYEPEGMLAEISGGGGNHYKYYYKGLQRIREEKLGDGAIEEGFIYSCDVKSQSLAEGTLEAVFLDASNNEIGDSLLEEIPGNNDWVTLSGNIPYNDLPSGAVSLELCVRKGSDNGDLWVGDMNLEEGEWSVSDIAYNYFHDNAGNLIMIDDNNPSTPTTRYIYAGSRLLAKEEGEDLHFYHSDRLGSPIMITDEDGDVVKQKKYEAFGNLTWSDGTYDDNREFTSKEKDPTGFHYFGARYYSGDIGRFLSPDPHTLMPGNLKLENSQDVNPYVYCYNNPVILLDPNGLQMFSTNWYMYHAPVAQAVQNMENVATQFQVDVAKYNPFNTVSVGGGFLSGSGEMTITNGDIGFNYNAGWSKGTPTLHALVGRTFLGTKGGDKTPVFAFKLVCTPGAGGISLNRDGSVTVMVGLGGGYAVEGSTGLNGLLDQERKEVSVDPNTPMPVDNTRAVSSAVMSESLLDSWLDRAYGPGYSDRGY